MECDDILWAIGNYISPTERIPAVAVNRKWRSMFRHALGLHRLIGIMNLKSVYSLGSMADEYDRAMTSRKGNYACRQWWRRHGKGSHYFTRLVEALLIAGH